MCFFLCLELEGRRPSEWGSKLFDSPATQNAKKKNVQAANLGVFCAFWLRHVLRATTACNFSSLIWPDGSAPAALASLLFDPPEPQIIGKTVFRDFPTFSRTCIFFLLTLSPLWSSLFYSSLLSDSSHLCFSSVHIVGSWLLNFLRISHHLLIQLIIVSQ